MRPRTAALLACLVLTACSDGGGDKAPAAPARPDSLVKRTFTFIANGEPRVIELVLRPHGYSAEDKQGATLEKAHAQDVKSGAQTRNPSHDVEGLQAFDDIMGMVFFDGDRYAGRIRCAYAPGYSQPGCLIHQTNGIDSVEGGFDYGLLANYMPVLVSGARAQLTRAPETS